MTVGASVVSASAAPSGGGVPLSCEAPELPPAPACAVPPVPAPAPPPPPVFVPVPLDPVVVSRPPQADAPAASSANDKNANWIRPF